MAGEFEARLIKIYQTAKPDLDDALTGGVAIRLVRGELDKVTDMARNLKRALPGENVTLQRIERKPYSDQVRLLPEDETMGDWRLRQERSRKKREALD